MTGMPHTFMVEEASRLNITLPGQGEYAVGNVFLRPDEPHVHEQKSTFESIAQQIGLKVLGWRAVPVDNSILGPSAKSKEPSIQQPFVVLDPAVHPKFDNKLFNRQLYLLRKQATHAITLKNWFYICSLSNQNIVYKGQLSPVQVYDFFYDLQNHKYTTHFALVHSRFSTNTFPSWDRAQPMRWAAHNGKHFSTINFSVQDYHMSNLGFLVQASLQRQRERYKHTTTPFFNHINNCNKNKQSNKQTLLTTHIQCARTTRDYIHPSVFFFAESG